MAIVANDQHGTTNMRKLSLLALPPLHPSQPVSQLQSDEGFMTRLTRLNVAAFVAALARGERGIVPQAGHIGSFARGWTGQGHRVGLRQVGQLQGQALAFHGGWEVAVSSGDEMLEVELDL